ncbi:MULTISPECIES: hypothetical protein [Stenotrophomonas]|jgi:hypothetical protein|uniref:Transmembrane protein n=1 Tax=Stenotrophomonas bentonitica TaxID=1450134 RepID=A0ABU9JTQ8_9GAMM|nr:hypothetical protein [Stenotrophomonas sp. HMSC10F06]
MNLLINLLELALLFACFLGLAGLAERAWRRHRKRTTTRLSDRDIAKETDGNSIK